jgi:plastocyanin
MTVELRMFVGGKMGAKIGVAGLLLVLSACGEYSPTGPQGGLLAGGEGADDTVLDGRAVNRLYDNTPSPGQITIPAGTVVEWRNLGANSHSVSNYSTHPQAETWDDALVEPRGEFVHVFDEPGEYGFVCIFHQEVGYVTVVESSTDDTDDTNMDDMTGLIP